MFFFGSGALTVTPPATPATPLNIGLVNEVKIDFTRTLKEGYGQFVDPVAIGAGTRKWTGSAKVIRISGKVLNALFFGTTLSSGFTSTATNEAGTIPSGTPWQITVANSATWITDQGVVYQATGLPLTRVASGPIVGQYSVAAGVYTFATADANAKVLISYNFTVAGTGQTLLIPQTLIGTPLSVGMNLTGVDPTTGGVMTAQIYNAVFEKLTFDTKLEDFVMPDLSFRMFANAAGSVGAFYFPDTF